MAYKYQNIGFRIEKNALQFSKAPFFWQKEKLILDFCNVCKVVKLVHIRESGELMTKLFKILKFPPKFFRFLEFFLKKNGWII